jgi:hypothetical protein
MEGYFELISVKNRKDLEDLSKKKGVVITSDMAYYLFSKDFPIIEGIESKLKKEIDLDFFDKFNLEKDLKKTKIKTFDPKKVLETLLLIKEIIIRKPNTFDSYEYKLFIEGEKTPKNIIEGFIKGKSEDFVIKVLTGTKKLEIRLFPMKIINLKEKDVDSKLIKEWKKLIIERYSEAKERLNKKAPEIANLCKIPRMSEFENVCFEDLKKWFLWANSESFEEELSSKDLNMLKKDKIKIHSNCRKNKDAWEDVLIKRKKIKVKFNPENYVETLDILINFVKKSIDKEERVLFN